MKLNQLIKSSLLEYPRH